MNRIDNISELNANNIFVFDNFLSIEECNKVLFHLTNDYWEQSSLITLDEDENFKTIYNSTRTTKTYYYYNFSAELRQILSKIKNEIITKINVDYDKMESFQISKYEYGEKFDFHIDGGIWKDDPRGERVKTILLYLMSPVKGGETFFRALNLYIKPTQGRLVVWDNLLSNGNCNYGMIHGGLPIKKGIKITLNTWVRQFS